MAIEPGTDTQQAGAPGTLEKFHLGLAADGMTCALVFVDEHHHSIACIASFADLNGFIVSLTRAATEMARRRAIVMRGDAAATGDDVDVDVDVTGAGDDRQAAVNIAMTMGLAPITGVPLPFVAYGGSSMLCCWMLLGLALNAKARQPLVFSTGDFD